MRQLLELFRYREAASKEQRAGIEDVLLELIRLLPDAERRRELASAATDALQTLNLLLIHQVQASESGDRRKGGGVRVGAKLNEGRESDDEQAAGESAKAPSVQEEPVIEAQDFPTIQGVHSSGVGGAMLSGAWSGRPPVRAPAVELAGGAAPTAQSAPENHFPALPGAPAVPQSLGAWGASSAETEEGAEPPPRPVVTKKTKRGALLLHFG